MKRNLLLFVILNLAFVAVAQRKSKPNWSFFAAGLGYMDGTMQFFEGYNYALLYSNAKAGLPVYSDWELYSQLSTFPRYYQANAWVQAADTMKRLRLRFSFSFYHRYDSLVYSNALGTGDVVYGRTASEQSNFYSAGIGLAKTTKKLFRFLYLFGGAEAELGMGSGSRIRFYEYSYDTKLGELIDENQFSSSGKFRVAPFISANVGMEIRPLKWVGLVFEARSGLGAQWVINEKAFGLSRTALAGSLAFYPAYFSRKKTSEKKS